MTPTDKHTHTHVYKMVTNTQQYPPTRPPLPHGSVMATAVLEPDPNWAVPAR